MPDSTPTTYPYLGENTLAFLLTLIAQDFAKKSEISELASDTNTTYAVSLSGNTVTLTGSDGSTSTFDIPAQVTVDSSITQNGTNPVQGGAIYTALAAKADSADIPTVDSSVAQNGANPVTGGAVYTAIQNALAGITSIDFQVVQSLPLSGTKGVIYLVANSGSAPNVYDEYIWAGASGSEAFEKIGTTDVNLSGYWSKSELVEMTNTEVTAVWNSVMNPSQQSGD